MLGTSVIDRTVNDLIKIINGLVPFVLSLHYQSLHECEHSICTNKLDKKLHIQRKSLLGKDRRHVGDTDWSVLKFCSNQRWDCCFFVARVFISCPSISSSSSTAVRNVTIVVSCILYCHCQIDQVTNTNEENSKHHRLHDI